MTTGQAIFLVAFWIVAWGSALAFICLFTRRVERGARRPKR